MRGLEAEMGDVMERERAIRERVAAAYCQPREAFATLVEWNNYLEEREDVAFNLVEGLDVARAEARLRAYSEKHADAIAKHQAEKAEEEAEAETRRMSYKMAGQVGEERQKGAEAGGGGGMPRSYAEEMAEVGSATIEQDRQWQMLAALAGGWRPEAANRRSLQESRCLFA